MSTFTQQSIYESNVFKSITLIKVFRRDGLLVVFYHTRLHHALVRNNGGYENKMYRYGKLLTTPTPLTGVLFLITIIIFL